MTDKKRSSPIFLLSNSLVIVMVLIFVICISTVSFFSFIEIRDRLTIEWNNASQATENHITTSIIQSNKDIRLLDSINDDDLKLVFIPFLEFFFSIT